MSRRAKREENEKSKIISKLITIAVFLGLVFLILKITPNYVNDEITYKTNLILYNSNVTESLKKDIIIEKGEIYIFLKKILKISLIHIFTMMKNIIR